MAFRQTLRSCQTFTLPNLHILGMLFAPVLGGICMVQQLLAAVKLFGWGQLCKRNCTSDGLTNNYVSYDVMDNCHKSDDETYIVM